MARGRSLERILEEHREALVRRHRVSSAAQLVRFVEACGFCYAFTLREGDVPLPACFDHLATRSVDRMWGWMWEWKDELPEQGRIYYGKLLRKKPTFVSIAFLPNFYAVHGRAGEDDDYLDDVRTGRMNELARRVYEALRARGEMQTKRLRADLGITSADGRRQYAKAVEELQRLLYVTRVRAVGEGREDYNYTYDLFTRRYPMVVAAAERVSSATAMSAILERAVALAGGILERRVADTFDWEAQRTTRLIDGLLGRRALVRLGAGRDAMLVLPRLAKNIAA
jgi:hypothetical protein